MKKLLVSLLAAGAITAPALAYGQVPLPTPLPTETVTIEVPRPVQTVIETVTEVVPGPVKTVIQEVTETVPGPVRTVTERSRVEVRTVTETVTIREAVPGPSIVVTERPEPTDSPQAPPTEVRTEVDIVIERESIPRRIIERVIEEIADLERWKVALIVLSGIIGGGLLYYIGWRERADSEAGFLDELRNRLKIGR